MTELASILFEDQRVTILGYRLMDEGMLITGLHAQHFQERGPKMYSELRQMLIALFHKDGGKFDPEQVVIEASKEDYKFIKKCLEVCSERQCGDG